MTRKTDNDEAVPAEPRDAEVQADEERLAALDAAATKAEVAELFDDLDLFLRPVEAAPIPSDEELTGVAKIANYLKRIGDAIAAQTLRLKGMNEEQMRVARDVLPSAMLNVGLPSFKLTDGSSVEVVEKVFASITKANQEPAFEWLVEEDHGDLIKTTIKVEFGKGELQLAQAFMEAAQMRWPKRKITVSQAVNPQTLGAFVREFDAAGKSVPEEVLGVHRVTEAVIREPGAAKAKGSKATKQSATEDEEF